MTCGSTDISNSLRYALDTSYQQAAILGLHSFSVTLITISNPGGSRPAVGGSRVRTEQRLTIGQGFGSNFPGDGYLNPQVRFVSQQDIVLSGNLLNDRDLVIGPFVYPYDTCSLTGGLDYDLIEPAVNDNNSQLYFKIVGHGLFENGIYCKRIYAITDSNLSYKIYVRNNGEIIP